MTTTKKMPTKLGSVAGDLTNLQRYFTTNQLKNAQVHHHAGAILRTKAKAPVIETTFNVAVQVPTEESGTLLCPEFNTAGNPRSCACGLGAMVRKAIDVATFTVSTPSPPDAYETVSSGFSVHVGTKMKPTTTPSTQGTSTSPDHHQTDLFFQASNHLALALHSLRHATGDQGIKTAAGRANAAARALNQLAGGLSNV